MRSVKGIIIGFLLILLGFAAAQYSLVAAGILAAGGLAVVVVSALPTVCFRTAALKSSSRSPEARWPGILPRLPKPGRRNSSE